jgi:hypothetical protein
VLQFDFVPARATSRVRRSRERSPASRRVGSAALVERLISACTRARSSEKAKGLMRYPQGLDPRAFTKVDSSEWP